MVPYHKKKYFLNKNLCISPIEIYVSFGKKSDNFVTTSLPIEIYILGDKPS